MYSNKLYFDTNVKSKNFKQLLFNNINIHELCPYFEKTYFDKACKKQQCHKARRSFEDIYTICKTYFPHTGKGELAYFLTTQFNSFYCPNIKKYVFFKNGSVKNFSIIPYRSHIDKPTKKDATGLNYYDILYMANRYAKRHKLKNVNIYQNLLK